MPQVATAAFWVGVAKFVAAEAVAVALSYAANKLTADNLDTGMRLDTQQSGNLVPIRLIYGTGTVAGVEVFKQSARVNNDDFDLHYALVLAGHECADVTDVWLDEVLNVAGAGGMNWSTNAIEGGKFDPDGAHRAIHIWKHLGTATQTVDAELNGVYPTLWTTNHRLRGVCYVAERLRLYSKTQDVFGGGPPNARFRVNGYKLYDPRLDSTNGGSGSQRIATPSTWTFSHCPPLALVHFLCFCEFGPLWDSAWIDWASVRQAATACDTIVAVPGATQARFACNGVLNAADPFLDNVKKILSCFRGTLTPNGDKWVVRAGVYQAPDLTLTEKDLGGGITMQTEAGILDRFNTVKITYIDPENNDVLGEVGGITDATYLARDGGFVQERQLESKMCNDFYQAQRLANLELHLGNQQKVITFPGNMRALLALASERVQVNIADWSFTNKVFVVEDFQFNDFESVDLVLREDSSSAYADMDGADYATRGANGVLTPGDDTVATATSASVTQLPGANLIQWTNPDEPFDYAVVYASLTSNWSGHGEIGRGHISSFVHFGTPTVTYWYWIRIVRNGVMSLRLPDSDTSTLTGTILSGPAPGATYSSTPNMLHAYYGDFETTQASDYLTYAPTNAGTALLATPGYMGLVCMALQTNLATRALTYDFSSGSAAGWTVTNGAFTGGGTDLGSTYRTHTSSGADPQLASPSGLTIAGATYTHVRARIRRTAGSGWDGTCYYSISGGHGMSSSFIKTIADPTAGAGGAWVWCDFNMASLTAGGTDWTTHTITQLRIDFGASSADVFDVDYVLVDGNITVGTTYGVELSAGYPYAWYDNIVFPAGRRLMFIAAFNTETPDGMGTGCDLIVELVRASDNLAIATATSNALSIWGPGTVPSRYQLLAFELDLTGTTDTLAFLRITLETKAGCAGTLRHRIDRCQLFDVTSAPQITVDNFPTEWVPAGGSGFGDKRRKSKPADETRTTNVVGADEEMSGWAVEATGNYVIEGTLSYTATSSGDFFIKIGLDGTPTSYFAHYWGVDGNGTAINATTTDPVTPVTFQGGSSVGQISFRATFTVSSVLGPFDFAYLAWAPVVSANTTVVKRSSFASCQRSRPLFP